MEAPQALQDLRLTARLMRLVADATHGGRSRSCRRKTLRHKWWCLRGTGQLQGVGYDATCGGVLLGVALEGRSEIRDLTPKRIEMQATKRTSKHLRPARRGGHGLQGKPAIGDPSAGRGSSFSAEGAPSWYPTWPRRAISLVSGAKAKCRPWLVGLSSHFLLVVISVTSTALTACNTRDHGHVSSGLLNTRLPLDSIVKLAATPGQAVLIARSQCPSCRLAAPTFGYLRDSLKAEGIELIVVASGTLQAAEQFRRLIPNGVIVHLDPGSYLADALDVGSAPTLIIGGPEGKSSRVIANAQGFGGRGPGGISP